MDNQVNCYDQKTLKLLIRNNKTYHLEGKTSFEAKKGDKLVILTPGGGGWER